MRLFFGLPFDAVSRAAFLSAQDELRRHAVKGKFTDGENLHLTLAFLGEVERERLPALRALAAAMGRETFPLIFRSLRCFPGGIWYLAPDPCPALMDAQSRLAEALQSEGFRLDARPYVPHLTLGRKIVLDGDGPPEEARPSPISAAGGPVRLSHSHREEGRLRYSVIG